MTKSLIDYVLIDNMTREAMLDKCQRGWRSKETPCGRGSELDATSIIRSWLPHLCSDYDVRVLRDAGAGDLNWTLHVEWLRSVQYVAYDLVPRAAEVIEFDITADVLPYADAILCRHVLNHLSAKFALNALDNFVKSGSRYLLMTMRDDQRAYWRARNLRLAEPINSWNDCFGWWVELHDLQNQRFFLQRPL